MMFILFLRRIFLTREKERERERERERKRGKERCII
jgi:hypothetical protein